MTVIKTPFHHARPILLLACFLLSVSASAQKTTSNSSAHTPHLTSSQWREDLKFAVDEFLEHDRSFNLQERAQFRSRIKVLEETVESKTDEQIIVGLARAVALARNAHTRLYLLRNRSDLRRYPIRLWWFSDGLYVVRATPGHAVLLGKKVIRIAGRAVENLRQDVASLYAGNASWRTYMSTYTMTSPEILMGLGLVSRNGRTEIEVLSRDGRRVRQRLEPLPLRRSTQPTESWWDLCPTRPRDDGSWQSALRVSADHLPLYLLNTERQYWSQYLPDWEIFYIQFNRSGNAPNGEPLAEFGNRALADLKTASVRKIVLDLRFNTGGDLTVGRSFIDKLAALARERQIRVYVITGRATFSAGIYHAMQLRQRGGTVLIGEPIGDELDTWSEGGNLVMPNSGLTLHFADRFHSLSPVPRPEANQYLVKDTDMSITNPRTDLRVGTSSRDYFAGRDPALDAIKRLR